MVAMKVVLLEARQEGGGKDREGGGKEVHRIST